MNAVHETVAQACRDILGAQIADDIIDTQSLQWAVVTAMAVATTDHDPQAIETIRKFNADRIAADGQMDDVLI